MRILLIANTASDILLRSKLLSQLQRAGHTLFIVASVQPKDEERAKMNGIHLLPINFTARSTNPVKDIALYFTYKKILQELNPHLILSYHIKPNIYGTLAAKRLNVPIIANITGLGKVFEKESLLQSLVVFLYKKAFLKNENAFIFFQNHDDKELFLQKRIIESDACFDVLPGSGVDIEFFSPDAVDGKPVFLSQQESEKLQFSYLGRLVISKGIRLFIEAAKRITSMRDDCVFNIAGSYIVDDKDFIQGDELEEACKNEAIRYYGKVSDVKGFLKDHTDCLVFPSSYREGVPRCLLEAAAMACPLIATDSVGTREPCKDGVNGFLVKKNDIDDLVSKIQAFVSLPANLKNDMRKASRHIAETMFSDEIVVRKYLEKIEAIQESL